MSLELKNTTNKDLFTDFNFDKIKIELRKTYFKQNLPIYEVVPFTQQTDRNHWDERDKGSIINSLIMHYTVIDYKTTMNIFTKNKKVGNVSSHYVITQEQSVDIPGGNIVRVVPNEKKAWHAGVSFWQGVNLLNSSSIGIENVNLGFTECLVENKRKIIWHPFDQKQMQSLGILSREIVKTYNMNPTCVLGHADIAPQRKQDPGILFPWETLHNNYGVGAWLNPNELNIQFINKMLTPKQPFVKQPNIAFTSKLLEQYGYNLSLKSQENQQFYDVVCAFQSHFSKNQCPLQYKSKLSIQDQLYIYGLVAKYKQYLNFNNKFNSFEEKSKIQVFQEREQKHQY